MPSRNGQDAERSNPEALAFAISSSARYRVSVEWRQEFMEFPIEIMESPAKTTGESDTMTSCAELASRIEKLQPQAVPQDVARLCLLLANAVDDLAILEDEEQLTEIWQEMGMRLQAATDQHAAMTEELESLARSDPRKFSADQIWILIRAIKVQSQVLQLYIGQPALDV